MTRTAPFCRCGQPCAWVDGLVMAGVKMPGWYSGHCGAEPCKQALDAEIKAKRDAAERAELIEKFGTADPAEIRRVQYRRDLVALGVPAELAGHTMADFPDIDAGKPRSWFIYGPNGTGKTSLAVALLRAWGEPFAMLSAYRLLSRVKSTFRKTSRESEEDVLNWLASAPVLCIDDLGAEYRSEYGLATIYEVVKERSERGLPTIITSNKSPTEIDKNEPRLASRIGGFVVKSLVGRDRRVPQ